MRDLPTRKPNRLPYCDLSPYGRALLAPTVSHMIQHLKGIVTKQLGFAIWQKSFHDHIIRNEHDYQLIWQYIDTNPSRWEDDCFFKLKGAA